MTASEKSDYQQIVELTHRYAWCVDMRDVDGMVALYTEDAIFDTSHIGLNDLRGHDGVRHFFNYIMKMTTANSHHISNHIINIDGNRATGTCYAIAMANTPSDEEIFATVHYDDVYVKVNGQWKFAQRRLWPHTKAKLQALPPAPPLVRSAGK